ncbi:MAG: discoidin domain-containing protein, partial [Chloroflexi bacterium]|nr:discoidin domain-containing protein [Chloroflexota bacterium]
TIFCLGIGLWAASGDPSYARGSGTATPEIFNSTTPNPETDPGNWIANGSLDINDFGLIDFWLQSDIDVYRWYLVQGVVSAPDNGYWVEQVDLSQEQRGYGFRSMEPNCNTVCSIGAVQIVYAEAGWFYTLWADSRVDEGASSAIILEFLDASRQRIDLYTQDSLSAEWSRLKLSAQAPAETQFIRVSLYSSGMSQGVVYWDNVRLLAEEIAPTTATPEPAATAAPALGVNVAANKPVIARAGGVTYAPWGDANDEADYNSTTNPEGGRWGIETNNGDGTFQVVDLLGVYELVGVGYSLDWDGAYANNLTFEVAVSLDNSTWTTVVTNVHEPWEQDGTRSVIVDAAIPPTLARYVRYWEPPDGLWNGWGDFFHLRAYAAQDSAVEILPTLPPPTGPRPSLTPSPTPAPPGQFVAGQQVTVYAVNDTLSVRSGPGLAFEILEKLAPGTVVTILEGPWRSDDGLIWWRVRTPREIEGWAVERADDIQTLIP